MQNVLLATVTKVEAQAVFEVFEEAVGKQHEWRRIDDKTYHSLGALGETNIFMVQSEMGSATPGGSLITLPKAIEVIKPCAIIMVGIAFGAKPEKQKLGDILVSHQIMAYEPEKEGKRRISRGVRVNASVPLLDVARNADLDWSEPKVHFGIILTGEKLVNNLAFRNRLITQEPEAVGGEMEANGLYLAASGSHVNWILVKAICDWADGTKNDEAQPLAAINAARFALSMLQHFGNSVIIAPSPEPPPPNNEYWELIKDLFIRELEKELYMNQSNYFKNSPEKYTADGKINYLAIMYFGKEKDEIAMLSNQLHDIYKEANKGFVSKSLRQTIKSKINEISIHQDLTSQLAVSALTVEPHHRLGETLRNTLATVNDHRVELEAAVAENKNGSRLTNSILNLHLQLHTLQRCLEDVYEDIETYLTPQ
jgi:nucleoside phosphorylase